MKVGEFGRRCGSSPLHPSKNKGMLGVDHVLNAMQLHYEAILNCFIEEQRIGEYKKLTENPFL